jgi:hypothetical protein
MQPKPILITLALLSLVSVALAAVPAWGTDLLPTGADEALLLPTSGSVALVMNDTVCLTWDVDDYPAGIFDRVEIYRGLTRDDQAWVTSLVDPVASYHCDSGVALDTTYWYSARLVYHTESNPDTEYTRVLVSADEAVTGWLDGKVFQDLVLPAGTYRTGDLVVPEDVTLTMGPGTRIQNDYARIQVQGGDLHVESVDFEAYTTIDLAGGGWVRDSRFAGGGRIDVSGDLDVQLSDNEGASIDALDATRVSITFNTGPYLDIDGTRAAHNVIDTAGARGGATLEHNTFGSLNLRDDAVARFNLVTERTRAEGQARLEQNVLQGFVTLKEDALATGNEIAADMKLYDRARLEDNHVEGEIQVERDASGVEIADNIIAPGRIVAANDWSCDTDPATAHIESNFIDASGGNAVEVSGGAVVTLVGNEIEGYVWATQECTRLTAQYNTIDGGLSTCWTPVLTVTDNVIDGPVGIGNAVPIICSGDASGIIARNTIQNNTGFYDIGMYLSRRDYTESHSVLSIRHNCYRNNDVAVDLFITDKHGPVDLRENWWGDPSGPNHPANPGGAGGIIETEPGEPVIFDPWDTAPTYCQDAFSLETRAGDVLLEVPDRVWPDGKSKVAVQVTIYDQDGAPYPGAAVGFYLSPELGILSEATATTDAQGKATVWYTPPELAALGSHDRVEIQAISGAVQEKADLPFEKPDALATAEPRYHQAGWDEWHALLPPDDQLEATLQAQLSLGGEPVQGYTVTLVLESLDGVYDGAFTEASNVVGEVEDYRVTLRTDTEGKLWVKYRPLAQSSRPTAVRDGVKLRSDPFEHLASWLVETGMDLELSAVARPGASGADMIAIGQAEPLLLLVRDALHPGFDLSTYNDTSDLVVDPMSDYLLGAWVDISHPARSAEFLDLLYQPHLQVPRHQQVPAYFYRAGNGDVYLRTPTTASNLPEVLPWMKNYNFYWIGVNLRRVADGARIHDTYALRHDVGQAQMDNNYRLIGFMVEDELLTAVETWFRDNPCNTNTRSGRWIKCVVGIMSNLDGLPFVKQPATYAAFALSLCETLFNYANAAYFDAAVGAGGVYGAALSDYLDQNGADLAVRGGLGQDLVERLGLVGKMATATDCFWAAYKHDTPDLLSACGLATGGSAAPPGEGLQELALWLHGLLQTTPAPMEGLIVLGSGDTTLVAGGSTPVITESDALTVTGESYFSLVNAAGSAYLVPPGDYSLALETLTDTHVLLLRAAESITTASSIYWEDPGTTSRLATLTFDAGSASAMQVDLGADGSIDRTVAGETYTFVATPRNVQVVLAENGLAQVSWDPVPGASGYRIYYGAESRWSPLFEGYAHQVEVGTGNSVGLAVVEHPGTIYYFAVTALDEKGQESLYSAESLMEERGRVHRVHLPLVVRAPLQ